MAGKRKKTVLLEQILEQERENDRQIQQILGVLHYLTTEYDEQEEEEDLNVGRDECTENKAKKGKKAVLLQILHQVRINGWQLDEISRVLDYMVDGHERCNQCDEYMDDVSEGLKKAMIMEAIGEIIDSFNVSSNLVGMCYIKTAMFIALYDVTCLTSIRQKLYVETAKIHDTSPKAVERAIERAIKKIKEGGNQEMLVDIFGENTEPNNSAFISGMVKQFIKNYFLS